MTFILNILHLKAILKMINYKNADKYTQYNFVKDDRNNFLEVDCKSALAVLSPFVMFAYFSILIVGGLI